MITLKGLHIPSVMWPRISSSDVLEAGTIQVKQHFRYNEKNQISGTAMGNIQFAIDKYTTYRLLFVFLSHKCGSAVHQ